MVYLGMLVRSCYGGNVVHILGKIMLVFIGLCKHQVLNWVYDTPEKKTNRRRSCINPNLHSRKPTNTHEQTA